MFTHIPFLQELLLLIIMIHKVLITILSLFLSIHGNCQSPEIINIKKIRHDLNLIDGEDVLRQFDFDFFRSIVFKNDSVLFYNPEGTLHLYEITLSKKPSVVKLSNGVYHGHNFKRLLFVYDDNVYSYGGEGLFNVNPYLIYFDDYKKEWLKQQIKNYPFDSRNVINSWVIGDTLRVLLNHWSEYNQNSHYKYNKYSFGFIDLKNFEYHHKLTFNNNSHSDLIIPESDQVFNFKEFTLFGFNEDNGSYSYQCLDKRNGDFFPIPFLNQINYVVGESSLYIENKTLTFQKSESELDTINLDSIIPTFNKNFIEIYNLQSSDTSKYLIISFLMFFLLVIIGIFILRKRKLVDKTDKEVYLKEIERNLMVFRGEIISKETLETQLGVLNQSYETNKTKRSALIRKLNGRGKVKIERLRKKEDKRFFNYKIS